MGRFWKDQRGKPVYSCWYYNVEFFGVTYSFPKIENLRDFRDRIAAQKLSSPFSWYRRNNMSSPLNRFYRRNGFAFLKFVCGKVIFYFAIRKKLSIFLIKLMSIFAPNILMRSLNRRAIVVGDKESSGGTDPGSDSRPLQA
jgi:hypothetical protein